MSRPGGPGSPFAPFDPGNPVMMILRLHCLDNETVNGELNDYKLPETSFFSAA